MASPTPRCYVPAVPVVATCVKFGKRVLEADAIGDEEECILRDHLLVLHVTTLQPATREMLLRHFVGTPASLPARDDAVRWQSGPTLIAA